MSPRAPASPGSLPAPRPAHLNPQNLRFGSKQCLCLEPIALGEKTVVCRSKCAKLGVMHAVRARIFALLAAWVMLLPSGASAHTEYYCRMMGRIVAGSACGEELVAQPASAVRELQPADCCQRLLSASRNASLGTRAAVPSVTATALATVAPFIVPASPPLAAHGVCAEATQAPLAIGPPLFLAHCALLN